VDKELLIRDILVIDKAQSAYIGRTGKVSKDVSENKMSSYFRRALKEAGGIYDKPVLVTETEVTHYGFVNGNFRRYRLEFIKHNSRTWTADYAKPIQLDHNDHVINDTIGRVLFAVPIIYKQDQKQRDSLDKPSGHITVFGAIPAPEHIERIMDGRYLTVSMGARSTDITCSICGKHPMSYECEHRMGKRYDVEVGDKKLKNQLAFADFGKKYYNEYSYVSAPGDIHAKTGRYELSGTDATNMFNTQDALAQDMGKFDIPNTPPKVYFFFGDAARMDAVTTSVTQDSFNDSDANPDILLFDCKRIGELVTSEEDVTASDSTAEIHTTEDKTEGDVNKQVPERDQEKEQEDKMLQKKYAVLHLVHSLLHADNMDVSDALKEIADVSVDIVGENLSKDDVLAKIVAVLDKMEKEDEEKDEKDKALTTKTRKKLSASTFCGPDKSWPVPDCQHVATARSFLAQSSKTKNLTTAQKARVRACVNRKARSLGCDKGKDDNGSDELHFLSQDEVLTADFVTTAIDELLSAKEREIDTLESKLQKTFINQIMDFGGRLEKVWAKDDEKRATYVADLKTRAIDSLEDTLNDLMAEAGISTDQDSQNNQKLDDASNETAGAQEGKDNKEKKDEDKKIDATAADSKADETVDNPGDKTKTNKENDSKGVSLLAKSGALR